MPRKKKVKPREVAKDPIYNSRLVTKLVNRAMKDGKKSVVRKEVYLAFEKIKNEAKEDPLEVFTKGLANIKPAMEVRSRRVGGAAYQVPMPVKGKRKESLAIRWLITAARARSNSEYKRFSNKLAAEIIEAAKNEGGAVKKREEMERIAEANRAFAHFKW